MCRSADSWFLSLHGNSTCGWFICLQVYRPEIFVVRHYTDVCVTFYLTFSLRVRGGQLESGWTLCAWQSGQHVALGLAAQAEELIGCLQPSAVDIVQLTLRATAFSPGATSHWCFIGSDHERVHLMRSRMQGEEVGRLGWVGRGEVGGKFLQSKREREQKRKKGEHHAAGTYTAEHLPVQCTHTNTAIMRWFFFLCVLSPPLPLQKLQFCFFCALLTAPPTDTTCA